MIKEISILEVAQIKDDADKATPIDTQDPSTEHHQTVLINFRIDPSVGEDFVKSYDKSILEVVQRDPYVHVIDCVFVDLNYNDSEHTFYDALYSLTIDTDKLDGCGLFLDLDELSEGEKCIFDSCY